MPAGTRVPFLPLHQYLPSRCYLLLCGDGYLIISAAFASLVRLPGGEPEKRRRWQHSDSRWQRRCLADAWINSWQAGVSSTVERGSTYLPACSGDTPTHRADAMRRADCCRRLFAYRRIWNAFPLPPSRPFLLFAFSARQTAARNAFGVIGGIALAATQNASTNAKYREMPCQPL